MSNKSNKKFAYLTNRPNLFNKSYWGCFDAEVSTGIDDNIIKNRNEFAEEFKIKAFSGDARPEWNSGLIDHCELYKCESGYVYITSPYREYDEIAEQKGFYKYKKLYLPNATTYVKTFKSKAEFNRFLKLD